MKKTVLIISAIVIALTSWSFAQSIPTDYEKNWPQWRGPFATGISPNGNPPINWSETKNVKWKIKIPGKGHSTPIIWNDQLFLTTAIATEKQIQVEEAPKATKGRRRGPRGVGTDKVHQFAVISINPNDGKIQWQTIVKEEHPSDKTHNLGSWASNSAVTDGENVWAYFGSRGLYCLDKKGKVIWERDFGQMEKILSFGEGSSPALYKDKIYVLWDHQGESVIYALDKKTGKDLWIKTRDERSSWATPFIATANGKDQLVVSATNKITSYDPNSGNIIWECSGMTKNVIPSPLFQDGILYITSGFRGAAFFAIDLAKAQGDITDSDAIIWQYNQDTPYTPSPVLLNNRIYMLRGNDGRLTCLDAKTGKMIYDKERLEETGNVFASLVGVKDRIYVTGRNGTFYVVKDNPQFEIMARNKLEDEFEASPIVIGTDMFLRGYNHLYCITE
jgi:outer membrane protein assembly factor BamB